MAEIPRCAYCRERPVDPAWRPFCSRRCKQADLGRWLTGSYRIPGPPADVPNRPSFSEPDPADEP